MTKHAETFVPHASEHWLRRYYLGRAAFSLVWVALALTLGRQLPMLGAALLVIYPAWDAAANSVDAASNGGLARNRSQAINVVISALTTVLVIVTSSIGPSAVLSVFGGWAIVSGLLQLTTAVRRWRLAGAQWAMVLSGAQSALAGGAFLLQAQQATPPVLATVAGYAGFGAVYFLISAIALWVWRKGATAETVAIRR
mgnify:CR=1 FL=1